MSTIAIGCALALRSWPVFGQAAAAPAFDVASIKPADPSGTMAIRRSGHHLVTVNTLLEFLIGWAYDIHTDRIDDKPKWLDSGRYDITANAPQDAWSAAPSPGQPTRLQQMMQALLADRFKLAVHRETRELAMYALGQAKRGARVTTREHTGPMGQNHFGMPGRGVLVGTEVTAEMLAKVLSQQVGRSVKDETGMRGFFDFKLQWEPDSPPPGTEARPGPGASLRSGASLFTAVQEQPGRKLEARKGPVEVLVIDHVESTPTEN
jgi:uncharacterized protein (TIGR03435 family)